VGGKIPRLEARLKISIVVPALNEADGITAALAGLAPLRNRGHEVIVVDGGSSDGTAALARAAADRVIPAPRGPREPDERGSGARARRSPGFPSRRHAPSGKRRRAHPSGPGRERQGMGAVRRAHRRRKRPPARDRVFHEPALARDRHRHRRPGDFRPPRCVPARRRFFRRSS